jgi:hypothetical protein
VIVPRMVNETPLPEVYHSLLIPRAATSPLLLHFGRKLGAWEEMVSKWQPVGEQRFCFDPKRNGNNL